jgi:DNA-binding transcriptional LysR family regulator
VSTVSRRISELERALKCKLFERSAEGFSLTEEGHKLLTLAEKMEATATDIATEAAGPQGREMSIVRVATWEALAALVIAPEWANFGKDKLNVGLELLVVTQTTNLGRREADIWLTMFELDAPRLISSKVGRFAVNLYASPQYLRNHGHPKSAADLASHVFIDYLDAFAISELKWLREFAPEARIVLQSTSLVAQQQAAIAGVGIAALPAYATGPKGSLVRLFPETTIWRDLWMTVHADNEYLSHIRAAAQFLKSRLPTVLDNSNAS